LQRLLAAAVMIDKPIGRFAYIAPLRIQAKTVAWDYLKLFTRAIPGATVNESELRVDMQNGARVQLYGADTPDALRGGYLDGVVMDEVAQMSPETWTHVVRPMLADREGWAVFIGTPQGKNAFYNLWEQAEHDPSWGRMMHRAQDTGLIAIGELEEARRSMTPEAFAQEFECSFTAAIKGAFYGATLERLEQEGRFLALDIDHSERLITGWDLGTRDATAIWVVQPYRGSSWAVVDYYEASGAGIDHYADWLGKHGYLRGTTVHVAPHDIANTDWSAEGGLNRKAIAERYGIVFERMPRPKNSGALMDEINASRSILDKAWFHSDSDDRGARVYGGRLSLSLYRQEYNEKLGALRAMPLHDRHSHAADAWRTFSMYAANQRVEEIPMPEFRINMPRTRAPQRGRMGSRIGQ
jgi:hypothetical protein